MAKRGRKADSAALHLVRGTDQPCRRRKRAVKKLDGEPARPKFLKGEARKAWDRKVARYRERSQSIAGCEDALAQYCIVEAHLIDCYRKGLDPKAALVTQHRVYASEFFDTPASQIGPAKDSKRNRFSRNGPPKKK